MTPERRGPPPRPHAATDPDDPEVALRRARDRFLANFPTRCDSLALLVDAVAQDPAHGPRGPLKQTVHRLVGLAGTVGFPTVSARAAKLEELVEASETSNLDVDAAKRLIQSLRDAVARDLAAPPPWGAAAVKGAPTGLKILVVEDDLEQRRIVTEWLKAAGYYPVAVGEGDRAVAAAKAERPTLILLDVELPGLDGYSICRLLKADPDLASIPVIFLTARAGLDDKAVGLTLGADEFLTKPLDIRELLLRVQHLLRKREQAPAEFAAGPQRSGATLTYEDFVTVGQDMIRRTTAALALIRLPREHADAGAAAISHDARRRDIVGRYNETHVVWLLPGSSAVAARDRLAGVIGELGTRGLTGAQAGVAASPAPGAKSLDTLLAEADEALAEARYLGELVAVKSDQPARGPRASATIIVADDDPEVTRIVDAQLRAAGYHTILVFDGEQALEALRAERPDLAVLDLMMPKMNGFEVLKRLHDTKEQRPRIIVLSARGREEDVTRAFELGADDYVTKPFSPQELRARIARLLR